MSRIVVAAATVVVIVGIGITIWVQTRGAYPPGPTSAVEARQYDTTGGQKMRPRWESSGEQSNDATGN